MVGGAGYVGTEVTAHLLESGYRVRCLDLLLYENGICVAHFLRHPNYEFQQGDMADAAAAARALEGVTDVVLLAGLVGDPITAKYPDAARAINEVGVAGFIDGCQGRGLGRLIFVSTCSNYGLVEGDQLADETQALTPLSTYAEAKVATERLLLGLKGTTDFHPTILRFATAFGISPRMRFDLTIAEFTRDLYLGRPLLVYDADTWRPYCHVADFANLTRRTLEAPVADVSFEVFNGGGDQGNCTKQMIVDAILERVPGAEVSYKEHGSDPRNYRVSFAKVRQTLGFEPRVSVQQGVDELLAAMGQGLFLDEVERHPRFFGNVELDYAA